MDRVANQVFSASGSVCLSSAIPAAIARGVGASVHLAYAGFLRLGEPALLEVPARRARAIGRGRRLWTAKARWGCSEKYRVPTRIAVPERPLRKTTPIDPVGLDDAGFSHGVWSPGLGARRQPSRPISVSWGLCWGQLRTRGQRRALALSTGLYSTVNLTGSTNSRNGAVREKLTMHRRAPPAPAAANGYPASGKYADYDPTRPRRPARSSCAGRYGIHRHRILLRPRIRRKLGVE